MQREQDRRDQADESRRDHPAHVKVDTSNDAVKNNIDEMVTEGIQTPDGKVPSKRVHGERPVRLVTLFAVHRSSPEVIPEQIFEWDVRPEVFVVPNGCHVIEDEIAR